MENMIQTICCACEQVLTFPADEAMPRYCITCETEISLWHDDQEPTDADMERMALEYGEGPSEDIEAFEDFWNDKEHEGERDPDAGDALAHVDSEYIIE